MSASSAYGLGRVGRWNRHTQKDKLELSKAGAAWSAELLLISMETLRPLMFPRLWLGKVTPLGAGRV